MPMKKQNARERERFMVRKKQTIQRKKIKHQLVVVNWKINRLSGGVKNKIEMTISWTLKTLQCNKITSYIHLIKSND